MQLIKQNRTDTTDVNCKRGRRPNEHPSVVTKFALGDLEIKGGKGAITPWNGRKKKTEGEMGNIYDLRVKTVGCCKDIFLSFDQ